MSDPIAMQKQIDDLEFENAELRKALVPPTAQIPLEWGLTPHEVEIVAAMAAREFLGKEQIRTVLYAGIPQGEERHWKNADVYIFKIRAKLKPFGVEIRTIWARGWQFDKEWRDKIMGRAA